LVGPIKTVGDGKEPIESRRKNRRPIESRRIIGDQLKAVKSNGPMDCEERVKLEGRESENCKKSEGESRE